METTINIICTEHLSLGARIIYDPRCVACTAVAKRDATSYSSAAVLERTETCARCLEVFKPHTQNQPYCGSKIKKTGCAWQNAVDKEEERAAKLPSNRLKASIEGKKWPYL